jgi:UDP-2-acetamido-3-amino-2,3-dideoxy-glucuronate N-acetyltransferase
VIRGRLETLRRIEFRQHLADGALTVYPQDADGVPFPIRRVFTIAGVSANGTRADHAHRGCSQLLTSLSGRVSVRLTDGRDKRVEELSCDGVGLLVPPMIWNSVTFESPTTVLAVFCDEPYDPADYVRDWNDYLVLQGVSA